MKHDLVDVKIAIPDAIIELLYATTNNFTGQKIYPCERCFLLKKTAERLAKVQNSLKKRGVGLKIWDAYRPLSVQKIFWSICPNPRYVAPPDLGSKHNRGAAVDVTMVKEGVEVSMPTGFDDFSEKAGRQGRHFNREILEEAMVQEGFIPYENEWWHYDDPDWEASPILDIPFDLLI